MELKEIETLLFIAAGAPVPVTLASEYKLKLLYYYAKDLQENLIDMPKQRNKGEDTGVAVIEFKNYLVYKFGYPNVEALSSHPYYPMGLEPYKLFEVVESDWVEKIEVMNRVHPFHNPIRYKMYRHFILTFEDSTFECIAREIELSFLPTTMRDALVELSLLFA